LFIGAFPRSASLDAGTRARFARPTENLSGTSDKRNQPRPTQRQPSPSRQIRQQTQWLRALRPVHGSDRPRTRDFPLQTESDAKSRVYAISAGEKSAKKILISSMHKQMGRRGRLSLVSRNFQPCPLPLVFVPLAPAPYGGRWMTPRWRPNSNGQGPLEPLGWIYRDDREEGRS